MTFSRSTVFLAAAAAAVALAAAASVALYAPARAQAGPAPCTCSAPVEVATSNLPTAPRVWMTNCQCGAQSCAVLNSQVLQCNK